jgi:hypothetical protein
VFRSGSPAVFKCRKFALVGGLDVAVLRGLLPKETKAVRVTLKEDCFVDAEEWTPKAAAKP